MYGTQRKQEDLHGKALAALHAANKHRIHYWEVEVLERSKIAVELQFPDQFDRLPRDLETTIFRLVQESLTNTIVIPEVLRRRSASRAWRTKCESKSRIRGKAFHRKRHRNFFLTAPLEWESVGCAKDSANWAAVSRLVLRGTEGVPSSWHECRS
jgi:hypothetical protein